MIVGGIMDPCESSPCDNSGTCTVEAAASGASSTQSDYSYLCTCSEKFTGATCDTPVDSAEQGMPLCILEKE